MNEEITIKGKAIYTPKGAAREYAAIGCNFYNGCPHDCEYCYLKRGVLSKTLGGTEVTLKKQFKDEDDALSCFVKDCRKYQDYLRKTGIFFSFSTDPMLRETGDMTMMAALMALGYGIPIRILTKCANVPLSVNLRINAIEPELRRRLAFGHTLTGRDDMEPYADSNAERIDAMKRLHENGFRTFASIEPIIDFDSSYRMIEAAADCCDLFMIGLRSGVKKDYYNAKAYAAFVSRVAELQVRRGFKVYWKKSVRDYAKEHIGEEFCERFFSGNGECDWGD